MQENRQGKTGAPKPRGFALKFVEAGVLHQPFGVKGFLNEAGQL